MFGRIKQDIRRKKTHNTILLPEGYHQILVKHGNVYEYGTDWQCFYYNASAGEFCKSKRTFRIGDAKVLHIDSDKVGFKQVYGGDFTEHPFLKKGKHWANFMPTVSLMVNCVKQAKKDDVLTLKLRLPYKSGFTFLRVCAAPGFIRDSEQVNIVVNRRITSEWPNIITYWKVGCSILQHID